jgi:hypothetical protein
MREEDESRDHLDPEGGGDARGLVDIAGDKGDGAGEFDGKPLDHRGKALAWAAPLGRDIEDETGMVTHHLGEAEIGGPDHALPEGSNTRLKRLLFPLPDPLKFFIHDPECDLLYNLSVSGQARKNIYRQETKTIAHRIARWGSQEIPTGS